MRFNRTVHGPVIGYATVNGQRVAVSRKRSSYLLDGVDLLLFQRLTRGRIRNARDFIKAASISPQTFNTFYADHKSMAMITTGRLPIRAPGVDPGLPTDGRGNHEWRGFLKPREHPQGIVRRACSTTGTTSRRAASRRRRPVGLRGARPRRPAQPEHRQAAQAHAGHADRRDERRGHPGRAHDDVRAAAGGVPEGRAGAQPARRADARAARGLARAGRQPARPRPRRPDRPSRRGHPGHGLEPAGRRRAWRRCWASRWRTSSTTTLHSRFDLPPGGQFGGWHMYMSKDLRTLLGKTGPGPAREPLLRAR